MGYPNMRAEMTRYGYDIAAIAEVTGKSKPAVSKNLNGKGQFTVDEALNIQEKLFPELTIDYLFSNDVLVVEPK